LSSSENDIKEDSNEDKASSGVDDHNHSHGCEHKRKISKEEHHHSDKCIHSDKQIDVGLNVSETAILKR
jgi:hypothetical protein